MKLAQYILLYLSCLVKFSYGVNHRISRNVDEFAYSSTPESMKNYAIAIDAGSTGSRVYVYWWTEPLSTVSEFQNLRRILYVPDYNTEDKIAAKRAQPGISSFINKLENLTEYLKPLLQYATNFISSAKRDKTILYILATVCSETFVIYIVCCRIIKI